MSEEQSWQASLTMGDRFSITMKLMSACKIAFPGRAQIELQDTARRMEESAFTQAITKDCYSLLWNKALDELPKKDLVDKTVNITPKLVKTKESPSSPSSIQLGPYIAQYHGAGLFSSIFRAKEPGSKRILALKLTTPSQMASPHNSHREARLLHLSRSEHIIPLLSDQPLSGARFLLTFPFLPLTLADILDQAVSLPIHLHSVLQALFSALDHIHSISILHRDIKPSNILLASPSGPAYLSDFGIAWRAGDPDSEPPDQKITDVGTSCYRAPELLFGCKTYGVGIDLWAAGCVVAETITARRRTLFDVGELGSELALIRSIFKKLGTPTEEVWPEVTSFPDWGKMQFYEYPPIAWADILPDATQDAQDLVAHLVTYESGRRLRAADVLKLHFFTLTVT